MILLFEIYRWNSLIYLFNVFPGWSERILVSLFFLYINEIGRYNERDNEHYTF